MCEQNGEEVFGKSSIYIGEVDSKINPFIYDSFSPNKINRKLPNSMALGILGKGKGTWITPKNE